jgi:hypothetical protein
MNTKDRRHSGRFTAVIYHPKDEPYEETFWDDWNDYRDGQRNLTDRSLWRTKYAWWSKYYNVARDNKKHAFLLKRRKQKQYKKFIRGNDKNE